MELELGFGDKNIESVIAYWNRRPCNLRHSNKEIGTIEYFNEVEKRKYFVEPHIPAFANFSEQKNKAVLEIGCGIGTDAINFIRAGAIYTGIDISLESINIARKRASVFGLNGTFLDINAEYLEFDNEFDMVYSFGVIHHSPNPRKIIESIHRACKNGGELRIMLYAKNSWKSAMIESGLDQPEAQHGCPIALAYDYDDVARLLDGLFDVTSVRQDHIFPYVIEKYLNYEYEILPWFKDMPKELYEALNKKFGWHMLIVAKKI